MLYYPKGEKYYSIERLSPAGRKGTQTVMFTRRFVLKKLEKIAKQLSPAYSLLLFDTYPSIETQADLFNFMC